MIARFVFIIANGICLIKRWTWMIKFIYMFLAKVKLYYNEFKRNRKYVAVHAG